MTHNEMIAVIQAHKEGKTIESRYRNDEGDIWGQTNNPVWSFDKFDYRIKPEPKTVPWNFDDYMNHADCWYRNREISICKIVKIDPYLFNIWFGDHKFNGEKIYFGELYYSPTPNGEFKPCVKEVQE